MTRRNFVGAVAAGAVRREPVETTDVFRAGDNGYNNFRIPALLATRKGTLLAFAEARGARSDSGNIDLVLKRSADGGRTWSALQVVAERGADTIGNPCPVQDRKTGRIFLPLTFNPGNVTEAQMIARQVEARRAVFLTWSDDDGRTWAPLQEITASVRKPHWTWYATGPGVGIQTHRGRMVIPCDHYAEGTAGSISHVFFSDDHGATWQLGGDAPEGTNESQVVELRDGSLMLNMRSFRGKNRRGVSRSTDGGKTWGPVEWDATLMEPVCQASLIARDGLLYFSNPATLDKRERLTVRVSRDEGRTWSGGSVLHSGPAAYSCLAALKGKQLGCLYECGAAGPYERIAFARFSAASVASGVSLG